MKPTCVFPTRKHPGHPVWALNFRITDQDMILIRDYETGRYFEAKMDCVRYKCCPKLIWIEKDYLPFDMVLDLTKEVKP